VPYLKAKALRDAEAGKGFAMQWLEPGSTMVPTLRKGYHKAGSTDPRLRHPTDPALSRLLTSAEHARIKGIDPALLDGVPETTGHQVCGQAVDVRPVRAIGKRLGRALVDHAVEQASNVVRTVPRRPQRKTPVRVAA
jgi:DNA (cytosine-5)-methyltransferase 1